MLIEMLLKLLVGVVDRDLLKTVFLERFKAKDIKDAKLMNRFHVITSHLAHLRIDRLVNFGHDPVEEFAVDGFRARVTSRYRFVHLETCRDNLSRILYDLVLKNAEHTLNVRELQKLSSPLHMGSCGILNMCLIVLRIHTIFNVSKV